MAHLGLEIEAPDDVLDIAAEAVEVFLEVGQEDLLIVGGRLLQLAERPLADVVEHIAGSRLQGALIQFDQAHLALECQFVHDLGFGRLQQGVKASQHHHGKNDVSVFAAHIDVAQAIIGNGPDERNQFVVDRVVHCRYSVSKTLANRATRQPKS